MTSLLLLCLLVSSCLVYTVIGAPCNSCADCVSEFDDQVGSSNCIAFLQQLKYGLDGAADNKCPTQTLGSTIGCVVGLTTARENLALQCTGTELVDALPASILLAEIEQLNTDAAFASPCVIVDAIILMLHGGKQICYDTGKTFTGSSNNSGKDAADLQTDCTAASCTSAVLEPVTTLGSIWDTSYFQTEVQSDSQLPAFVDPNAPGRRLASSGRRLQNQSACEIFVTEADDHISDPSTATCPNFAQALACAQDVEEALAVAKIPTKCGSHYDDTIKLQFQLEKLTESLLSYVGQSYEVDCEGIDAILDLTYNLGTLYGECATEIVKQNEDQCAAVDSIKTICGGFPEEGTVFLAIENAISNRGGEFESVRAVCESVLETLENDDCPQVDAGYKQCIVEAATIRQKLEDCDAKNAKDEFLHFSQYAAYVESLLGDMTTTCPSRDALVNILKGGTAECYTAAKEFTTSDDVDDLSDCTPSDACVAALEPLESVFEMWKATIGGVATFPFSEDAIQLLAPSSRRLAGTTDTACDTFAAAGAAYLADNDASCPTLVDALACTSLIITSYVETECGKRYYHESVFQYLLDDLLDTSAASECPGLEAIIDLNHVDSDLNNNCVTALSGWNSAYTTDNACVKIQDFEENAFDCPTQSNYDDCNDVVASSIDAIIEACPEYTEGGTIDLTIELFEDIAYTYSYQTIMESCSVFISSLEPADAQCPTVISQDIKKCIVDAATVRQKVGKQCDSLDLVEISVLARYVESLGEAIDGDCKIAEALVNILKGGKTECYEAAIAFTTSKTAGDLSDCTPSQTCTDALEPFDSILAMWGTNFNSQVSEYFTSPAKRLLSFDARVLIEDSADDDDDSADDDDDSTDDEDVGPCAAFVEAGEAYLADNDASCPSLDDALSCTFELQEAGEKVVAECGENYYHTIILQYYLADLNTDIAAVSSTIECSSLTAIVELNFEDSLLSSACSMALAGWDDLDDDDTKEACNIVWEFEQGGTECPEEDDYTVCKEAMDAMVETIEDACSASIDDTTVVETLKIVEKATFVYVEAEVEKCEAETEASTTSAAPVNMMYSTFVLVIALLLHIVF